MLQSLTLQQHFLPLSESLQVDDPVWKAWRVMKECDIKQLPVVKNGKIVGIVSAKDIVQISGYNGGQSMPVKEAMSLDPLIVKIDMNIAEVLKAMLKKEQQNAIVVDGENEICGIFTWDCAFRFFLQFSDPNENNQPLSG